MVIIFGITLVLFIIVSLFLILLVLIQNDKGGGISGAIGGGLAGANSVIGTQDTANILTKMTTGFAIGYMVLCVILSLGLTKMAAGVKGTTSALKKKAETSANYDPSSVLQGSSLPMEEEGSLPVAPVEE